MTKEKLQNSVYWLNCRLSSVAEEEKMHSMMRCLIAELGVDPDDMRELEISAGDGKRYVGAFYSANLTLWEEEQLQKLEDFLRANGFEWDICDDAMVLM